MSERVRLTGLGLLDRVQEECVAGSTVRLVLDTGLGPGEICVEDGEITHARWEERTGPEALYAVLEASRVGCSVTAEPRKPVVRSLTGPWRSHLLESLERIERRDGLAEGRSGVERSVRVSRQGIAASGATATEREAGLVAFLGRVGEELGSALALGRLDWIEAEIARTVWLVAPDPEGWRGARLVSGADPAAARARLLDGREGR